MVSLEERVKTRWLQSLEDLTRDGLDIDGIKNAVDNTLPAIIREEVVEYAKSKWYEIASSLQENSVSDQGEKHVVSNKFVENVYKELASELDETLQSVIAETLSLVKEIIAEKQYEWEQLLRHLDSKLKEEKAVIESIFAVEKRKFINEVFTRVIDDISKELLDIFISRETDLFASYVAELIGGHELTAIWVSTATPEALVKEIKRELGKDLPVKKMDSEDIVILADTGNAKLDISPGVIVKDIVSKNLASIRDTVLREVVS